MCKKTTGTQQKFFIIWSSNIRDSGTKEAPTMALVQLQPLLKVPICKALVLHCIYIHAESQQPKKLLSVMLRCVLKLLTAIPPALSSNPNPNPQNSCGSK